MQDVGREKNSRHNIHAQGEPTGSDVSQDLTFVELHEPRCICCTVSLEASWSSVGACG